MKSRQDTFWSLLLGLNILLAPLSASGTTAWTPKDLPKVHIQDRTRYVTDPEGLLSEAVCDSIDRMFYALETAKGIEAVIAAVPSIGQAECFDFCHELLNSWGVGKESLDNGLVILLVTDQRCIQFYTGYGLEGILPDAVCKRIQTQEMIPFLKEGNWNQGMLQGCARTVQVLTEGSGDYLQKEDESGLEWEDSWLEVTLSLAMMGLMGLTLWLRSLRKSRCPSCGKHRLKRMQSRLISDKDGVKTYEVTFLCTHCGHVSRKTETMSEASDQGSGRGLWTPPAGGGMGRGFHGGSFGGGMGGRFGGGRGGGGGAGSRF